MGILIIGSSAACKVGAPQKMKVLQKGFQPILNVWLVSLFVPLRLICFLTKSFSLAQIKKKVSSEYVIECFCCPFFYNFDLSS